MASIKRFFIKNIKIFKRIHLGFNFKDKLAIFGIAILESFPTFIRKKIPNLKKIINQLCYNTIIEVNGICYFLLDYQSFEIILPEFESFMKAWFNLRRGEIFIDVGAHIGKYTLPSAKIVGNEGKVLAFEPYPINYQVLIRNIELNKIGNVIPINLASWNEDTTLKLFIGEVSGQHSIRPISSGYLEVEACALDHVLSRYPKID